MLQTFLTPQNKSMSVSARQYSKALSTECIAAVLSLLSVGLNIILASKAMVVNTLSKKFCKNSNSKTISSFFDSKINFEMLNRIKENALTNKDEFLAQTLIRPF
eukprot:NODE_225_length_12315_cov_1.300671.p10 type:complete len:104 gc:universal NODE_225_length_12315_cov_1.300671:6039-6350(+)